MKAQIPWLRVFVEGVVIVGSILLAFGLQAWWEESVEGRTLAAALDDLVSEVSVGRTELATAVEENRSRIELYRRFMSLTPEEVRALPMDSLTNIGWSFYAPRTFDPGGSALESLLVGGNLNAIGDEKLRTAIMAWARFPDEIDDDYRIAADVTLAFRQRLTRHGLFPALLSDEQPQPQSLVRTRAG